jgi:hypothetical protein
MAGTPPCRASPRLRAQRREPSALRQVAAFNAIVNWVHNDSSAAQQARAARG